MKNNEKEGVNAFPPQSPATGRKTAKKAKNPKSSKKKRSGKKKETLPLTAYVTLVRLADWQEKVESPIPMTKLTAGMPKTTVKDDLKRLERFHGQKMALRGGGLTLTPAAESLAVLARTLVETADALKDRKGRGRPVLRLGGYNTNFRDLAALLLRPGDPKFDTELIPAYSQEEMVSHLRNGITDIAFSYVTEGSTPAYIKDDKTFGRQLIGTYETIPIASREHAAGNVNKEGFWGDPKGFVSLNEAAKDAERLIFDGIALPEIELKLPPKIPIVMCDWQGTVTTLVRQNRGVGLIWNTPVLLTEDIVRGRFKETIRTPIKVYAIWRNDVLEERAKLKGDPMMLAIQRLQSK